MFRNIYAFGVAVLVASMAHATTHSEKPMSTKQVIAYVFVRDRILEPGDIAAQKLTRINYAFANVEAGKLVEGFAHDRENFAALNDLKKENPALKVLVSVGGWTWSKNFSDVALNRDSRKAFIDSAVKFVEKYDLDGLDIDWEYPGLKGDNNPFRAEDKANYTALLRELRVRFDTEGHKLHRHLYTSVATGSDQTFLDHTEMAKVARYVDTVNLMTYDMYGGDRNTGHHAPLYDNPDDPKHVSSDKSVRAYLAAGVPRAKLVLGVPFYGKGWQNVAADHNGLFQSGVSARNLHLNYANIQKSLLQSNSGYQRYWDYSADSPYLYNASLRTWVDYEDAESLEHKTLYVMDHHLGGVMFWEYSGDSPDNALLNAIDKGLGIDAAGAKHGH